MYKCKFGERKKEKTRFIYHMVYEGKENVEADRLGLIPIFCNKCFLFSFSVLQKSSLFVFFRVQLFVMCSHTQFLKKLVSFFFYDFSPNQSKNSLRVRASRTIK